MKILVDVAVEPAALAALEKSGRFEIDCITPPAEIVRELDPVRVRDADVLFCTFPPKNFSEMKAVRWVQLASTGYTQLFGLERPSKSPSRR